MDTKAFPESVNILTMIDEDSSSPYNKAVSIVNKLFNKSISSSLEFVLLSAVSEIK